MRRQVSHITPADRSGYGHSYFVAQSMQEIDRINARRESTAQPGVVAGPKMPFPGRSERARAWSSVFFRWARWNAFAASH